MALFFFVEDAIGQDILVLTLTILAVLFVDVRRLVVVGRNGEERKKEALIERFVEIFLHGGLCGRNLDEKVGHT